MPSSVVTAFPLTAATGVTHERISFPSSSTEHAPHCASPHPNLGPCRWSSLCRTYSRGVSRLAVTLCTRPFTLIFSLLAIRFLPRAFGGAGAPSRCPNICRPRAGRYRSAEVGREPWARRRPAHLALPRMRVAAVIGFASHYRRGGGCKRRDTAEWAPA